MTYRVPDPPTLSDKLADFEVLAAAGGDALFVDKDVLDVGPLYGFEGLLYAARAKRYVVLDCDEAILSRQHWMAERVKADITLLPWNLEGGVFDTVLDLSTFDDTQNPTGCYVEASRVIREGGILVTAFANALCIPPTTEWTNQYPDRLVELLGSCGFDIVKTERLDQPRAYVVARRNASSFMYRMGR